jgi:putative tryptophan/tyrosine transport system substrate-binding protein
MKFDQFKRRDLIALLGGAVATWPLAVRAQQPAMPVIGYLDGGSPETSVHVVAAIRKGLSETGYVEGRHVVIEYHWANGNYDRLSVVAPDLARRQVAVIVAMGTPAAFAAKAATSTIPVVFGAGVDPVQAGLVASLNRPGGNVTGVTSMNAEIEAKRLGFLHELLPRATRFAVLVNPKNPLAEADIKGSQASATDIGGQVEILTASTNREIDAAFASIVQKRAEALLIGPDVFFTNRRVQLATLAVRHGVPAIYAFREFADAGGLMSYGTSNKDRDRQVGVYAGRILKGEKPADLPILQPTKFEFVINLQTARTLGLDVPPTLLARADEVIE